MDPTHLCTLPATIVNRTPGPGVDGFGTPTMTDADPITTTIELQQQRREENTDRGEVGTAVWLAIIRPDVTITEFARVHAGGYTYEVDGPPWAARNPRTGTVTHIEATLKRTGGTGEESSS